MKIIFVLIAALAPIALLLWQIYRKDKVRPEPTSWLMKAFLYGIASTGVAIVAAQLIMTLTGISTQTDQYANLIDAFASAFLSAAIPEECAKLLMLWLVLKKNPYFDEHFDGIVYAVCIGLGFAALENVMYLMTGIEDGSWLSMGISRALTAVPGHFFFAVLMGYYYSLYHFGVDRSKKGRSLVIVAPVLAHGLYDGILFSVPINEVLGLILMVVFLIFLFRLKKIAKAHIEKLVGR